MSFAWCNQPSTPCPHSLTINHPPSAPHLPFLLWAQADEGTKAGDVFCPVQSTIHPIPSFLQHQPFLPNPTHPFFHGLGLPMWESNGDAETKAGDTFSPVQFTIHPLPPSLTINHSPPPILHLPFLSWAQAAAQVAV